MTFYTVFIENNPRSFLGGGFLAINKGESAAIAIGFVAAFFMFMSFMGGREQFFLYLGIVVLLFVVGGVVFHFYDSEMDTGEEQEPKMQEDS